MTYGLAVFNPSGQLVISADAVLYGYIGRATFVSATAPGNPVLGDAQMGYSTYSYTWSGSIMVAAPLTANYTTFIRDISQSGSVWTINVYNSNSIDANGFGVQTSPPVYVFVAPVSASGYGMALYNSAGAVVADLSRSPMFFKAKLSYGAAVMSLATPGGITLLGVFEQPAGGKVTTTLTGGSPSNINKIYTMGVYLDSTAATVQRNYVLQDYFKDDAGVTPSTDTSAYSLRVLELTGLT